MKIPVNSKSIALLILLNFCINIKAQTVSNENLKLSKSDIAFSMRFYDYLQNNDLNPPQPAINHNVWNSMATTFYANRLLWHIKRDSFNSRPDPASFYQEASGLGYPFQYSKPLYLPKDVAQIELMQATNLCDSPTRGKWEDIWDARRPDVNSEIYYTFQLERLKKLIDEGNLSFQQDSPSMNEELVHLGGSFTTASMEKFNVWLQNNLSSTELNNLGISDMNTFNYKNHLINLLEISDTLTSSDCNDRFIQLDDSPGTLKFYYREFQEWATIEFYKNLHKDMNDYIQTKYPGKKGVYSANNLAEDEWLKDSFDYWETEVYPKVNGASIGYDIIDHARFARATFYTAQGNENTSAITIANTDKWTNQIGIALSYASGMVMIAPWDVYYSSNSSRYYGNPMDFDHLLSFVRNNEALFNDYNTIEEHIHTFDQYEKVKSDYFFKPDNGPERTVIKLLRNNNLTGEIPLGTKIKIGDSIYNTTVSSGVGSIYLSGSAHNSINAGDPVWYLEFPDGTRYFDYTSTQKSSLHAPPLDITSGFITNVLSGTNPDRTTLYWTNGENITTIPNNSKILINDKVYTTTVTSNVGNIYLAPNTIVNVDDPIWYIQDPEGNIIYPKERPYVVTARQKGDYNTSGKVTTVLQGSNPNRTTLYWTDSNGLNIPTGSEVLINDKKYFTTVNTETGHIYLPENTDITIGDAIWLIKDPNGKIIYPQPHSGRVTNAFNDPAESRTIIYWDESNNQVIPKGSKVLINDKIYTTTTLSNVGNIYLKADTPIVVNDRIWHIKHPDGSTIYAADSYQEPVVHIINLSRSSKKVAIKIAKNRFSKLFQKTISPNNPTYTNVNYSDIGTHYIYKINNLIEWSVLTQNPFGQNTKSISNTNLIEDYSDSLSLLHDPIHIYPNPTNGPLTIEFLNKNITSEIEIYNTNGQKIYGINDISNQLKIDLSLYPKSLYFVKIKNPEGVFTKKIILNK